MRQTSSRRRLGAAALAGLLAVTAFAAPAVAQERTPAALEVAIQGRVGHPRTLALAELQALPPITLEIAHETSNGVQRADYTGALLWTLVAAAGPIDEPGGRAQLQHTLLARGRDGYAAALAIGELDPHFEGKQVLIAYAQDGKPLPGLRLVIPADAHAGRNVRDLVAIEIR